MIMNDIFYGDVMYESTKNKFLEHYHNKKINNFLILGLKRSKPKYYFL